TRSACSCTGCREGRGEGISLAPPKRSIVRRAARLPVRRLRPSAAYPEQQRERVVARFLAVPAGEQVRPPNHQSRLGHEREARNPERSETGAEDLADVARFAAEVLTVGIRQ